MHRTPTNLDYPTIPAARRPLPRIGKTRRKTVLALRTGHYTEVAPYRELRPQGTADWYLSCTLRGSGVYRQPDVEFATRPGDLVVLEPGAYHDHGCDERTEWEFIWVRVAARAQWVEQLQSLPLVGKKLRRLSIPDGDAALRQRMRDALLRCHKESCIGMDRLSGEFALHALHEVILLAARASPNAGHRPQASPAIRSIIERLVEHLDQRHTLASLARTARMSPSHLSYRFKRETGSSVIAYLLNMRVRQAAQLLEHPERRIQDVAAAVGLHDPFYFSRQFRRFYAMSPRQYQAKANARNR
ncbi:MAG: helix-turn-helix domain-containing protein [Planctomycetes bacterium]|nr:helix-turn-helix domain-containing protein [Planctomycetota bacterium]